MLTSARRRIAGLAIVAFVSALAVTLWPFRADGIGQLVTGRARTDQSRDAAVTRVVEISVRDGKLLGGPLRTVQNDLLVLEIESDEEEQFHVEGYHAFTTLSPGRTMRLEIWTATVGNFPILLDKSKRQVGNLEVVSRPQ